MMSPDSVKASLDLSGRVAIITGGAGMLGVKHAEAVAELGGIPVLLDIDGRSAATRAEEIVQRYGGKAQGIAADITKPESIANGLAQVLNQYARVDILINNAANDPKVDAHANAQQWSRLENFPLEIWQHDIAVGLTGAFLCSKIIGAELARRRSGVIVNIASDLALIAPDQRIYRKPGVADDQQFTKPVTYSVIKSGLIGLTRYLATYWAVAGVRVNAICPGGVRTQQDEEFVQRLTNLIPMARMADPNEYKSAIAFLISDASSYMTGATIVIDGGRTAW